MAGSGSEVPQSSELLRGPGFRVRYDFPRIAPEVVDRFKKLDIAVVSDLMNRLYTLQSGLHPIVPHSEALLVGTACTVKVFPGDNLMVHASLDCAGPGDIVVVDTAGSNANAVLGDMVTNKARSCGIAGFVVDGLVRDVDGMREAGVPVFARGVTPRGPLHRGPGELNYPIACGGVTVNAGDLVIAGTDGVVIVPHESVDEILERAEVRMAKETLYVDAVKKGDFTNDWVAAALRADDCQID
ncbi:MAG: RraA family protein [Candidatus Poriferisodalaceae bacterium]|jgi:RraA family protein